MKATKGTVSFKPDLPNEPDKNTMAFAVFAPICIFLDILPEEKKEK